MANRVKDQISRNHPLQRMKDRRMVSDHQIAFLIASLFRHRLRVVNREQDSGDILRRIACQQADVVPRFRQ